MSNQQIDTLVDAKLLIERFEAAFNRLEKELRKKIKARNRRPSFSETLRYYLELHPRWPFYDELKKIANIRNVIVHDKISAYQYLAIPSEHLIHRLEYITASVSNDQTILQIINADVQILSPHDRLDHVLKLMFEKAYSQFPVYEDEKFKGLLTENGVVRWLAKHVSTELSLVDMESSLVGDVLTAEEQRDNVMFIGRNALIVEVNQIFLETPFLEAIMVTHSGSHKEKLLGLVTSWDIFSIKTDYGDQVIQ